MTAPDISPWPASDVAHRRSEASALVGTGDELWARASVDVLRWRVKTASGFTVADTTPVVEGQRLAITARVASIRVVEPVEVVTVVRTPTRTGFSYRTLPGHPLDGEEAFILERRGDEVWLTVRSLTRPASKLPWRMLYPLLLVAQRVVRRRYLRALG